MINFKIPLLLLTVLPVARAAVAGKIKSDLSVKVDETSGTYTLSSASLHWKFSGSVGASVRDVDYSQGTDDIGAFTSVSFRWQKDVAYAGTIRCYEHSPVAVFSLTLPGGSQHAPVSFPDFTSIPHTPYHFSFQDKDFAPPVFDLEETSTPWLLFDEKMHACIVSPASDFIVSKMTGDGTTEIRSGMNAAVSSLPEGFTHSTMVVMDQGIQNTWNTWGSALRAMYHRRIPANDHDAILKYYGYWTDNGADYYYNYDTTKGYNGTLLALRDYYKAQGIPIGYMQLDSWWYEKSVNGPRGGVEDHKNKALPKGPWNRYGGLMEYRADPYLFPDGLQAFGKKINLPFITHNRWVDPESPYQRMFRISGVTPVDEAYWKDIIDYIKSFGAVAYEQDWLNIIYERTPAMASDVKIGNAFTDGMARVTGKDGLDMQYCMAMPRFFLQGVKYNNLTTIRTSPDRFEPKKWKHFLFTTQLGYQMGIWPWSDVFMSHETGNMIASVLSAGPVGTGDAIGREDKRNIFRACRADGVLVKPDAPLLPTDQAYLQQAKGEDKPVTAYTYTRHTDVTTGYLFCFATGETRVTQFSVKPSDLGMTGEVVIYSPETRLLKDIRASDTFSDELGSARYNYYLIAPVTKAGIAFLGDEGKIAATGKKRVEDIRVQGDKMIVTVLFAAGESGVTLQGYAARPVSSDQGTVSQDPATHLFTVRVPAPGQGGKLTVTLTASR